MILLIIKFSSAILLVFKIKLLTLLAYASESLLPRDPIIILLLICLYRFLFYNIQFNGKKLTFLGIETSCDETAAAVVQENKDGTAKVLSNIVSSQIKEHEKFGGVVPEIAARAYIENIDFIIQKALKKSKKKY